MSKRCTYTYYDSKGNPSEEYQLNVEKYGSEAARAIFISNALKDTIPKIRFSTPDGIISKLKTRIHHEKLSEQGYIGVTSIIAANKKSVNKKAVIAYGALGLKISNSHPTLDSVIDYFKFNKETNEATDHVSEFNALKIDAENKNEFSTKQGTEIHLLMRYVCDEHRETPAANKKSVFNIIEEAYKKYLTDKDADPKNPISREMLGALKPRLSELLGIVNELNSPKGKDKDYIGDYEFYPEVSLFSDDVVYDGKPLQGHVDILIYSPSRNNGIIIDLKTKTEASFGKFGRGFDYKTGIFQNLIDSPENDAEIQTSAYSILAKQQYGINIIDRKVLLMGVKFHDNGEEPGSRTWRVGSVDNKFVELVDLKKSQVAPLQRVLGIKEIKPLGERGAEELIRDIFDDKLLTVTSSKDNFVNFYIGTATRSEDGKLSWNHPYDRQIKLVKDTEDELREAIGEVYEEYMVVKKRAANDLIHFFEHGTFPSKSAWQSERMTRKAITLTKRFHKDTHDFIPGNSILPNVGDDVIIVINKDTKEVSLISITMTYNDQYYFNDTKDEDTRSTIYGPFLSDKAVVKKYGRTAIPQATTHNLNKIKLMLLASELKIVDPAKFANITDMLSTCLLSDGEDAYSFVDMKPVFGWIKEIQSLYEESGKHIPSELETIVNNSELNTDKAFEVDYFENFIQSVQRYTDPLFTYFGEHPGAPKRGKLIDKLRASLKEYVEKKGSLTMYQDIANLMGEYVQTLYSRLLVDLQNPETVFTDSRFVAANRAFLAFKNLMVAEDPTFRGNVLGTINSLTTIGNPTAEKLHIAIAQYEQQARDQILDQINEHVRLQKKLMENTPGVNMAVSIFDPSNFKKVFKDMLEDGYDFNSDNVENWMKFKDPEKLSGVQKEYVIFYNSIVEKAMETLFGKSKKNLMYPDETSLAQDAVKKWKKGYIPILPKAASVDFKKLSLTRQGIDSSLEMIKNIVLKGKKSTMDESNDSLNPWEFSSFFPEQVDNSVGRGSKKTRYYLGITADNKVISEDRSIELDPTVILNALIVEAARKEHMTAASFAAFAIQAELVYKDTYTGVDTKALREIIGNIVNIRIHGKVKEEGKFADVVDITKNLTGIGMFWGSFRQFFTESGTATIQLTSQSLANFINKHFFKGNNAYGNKDFFWAAKHLMSDFGNNIITSGGLFHSGLMEFTESEYAMTKKNLLYQTKHGFAAIRMVLKQSVQTVVLAQMHKLGITEKCYDKDYKYDETKDTRFYVWDPELNLEGKQESAPTTPDEIKRYNLWKAHRLQFMKEGGIDIKTGRMIRPFIVEELQSMKQQAIRLLGAMDNSEAMAMEYHALGRAAAAYKKWIRTKIANYWTPKSKSFKMGRWKEQEDGEFKFIYEDFEGILNSVVSLYKDIRALGFSAAISGMTDIQKRNFSKLFADLLLTAALTAFLIKFFEELFEDNLLGDELTRGLGNAASDIFPALAVVNTIQGSPMASISIALNTAKNAYRVLGYMVTGDLDGTLKATDKTFQIFGAYRAGKSLADFVVDFEPNK